MASTDSSPDSREASGVGGVGGRLRGNRRALASGRKNLPAAHGGDAGHLGRFAQRRTATPGEAGFGSGRPAEICLRFRSAGGLHLTACSRLIRGRSPSRRRSSSGAEPHPATAGPCRGPRVSIGLCALLIVEGIVGVNLDVTALGPVAVATFVATLVSDGRGFTFWIHEGVLLPGGRSAPRMSSLITRPMKRQMIRDVILPRQDYTIPGQ